MLFVAFWCFERKLNYQEESISDRSTHVSVGKGDVVIRGITLLSEQNYVYLIEYFKYKAFKTNKQYCSQSLFAMVEKVSPVITTDNKEEFQESKQVEF